MVALLESGVIDQNVYATEPLVGCCKELGDLVPVRNVNTDSPGRVFATPVELSNDPLGTHPIGAIVHNHLSTRGMQGTDDIGSNAS